MLLLDNPEVLVFDDDHVRAERHASRLLMATSSVSRTTTVTGELAELDDLSSTHLGCEAALPVR